MKLKLILTAVSTIFMPLTLIAGRYRMNTTCMPELDSPYANPIVMIAALAFAIGSLLYFKKE